MPSYQVFPTQAINPLERNYYTGCFSTGFMPAAVDTFFPNNEVATGFTTSVTGVVVFEKVDGTAGVIPVATAGVMYRPKFRRVLTSATIGGNLYTTSATGIIWFGGES